MHNNICQLDHVNAVALNSSFGSDVDALARSFFVGGFESTRGGADALSVPQANKKKREVIFKRAESYVKEYREEERRKIKLVRDAKQSGSFFVPEEANLIFVIRIKG